MLRIANIDTLADFIDRLIVEVNKISVLETLKFEEHQKLDKNTVKIAAWDKLSREAVNLREQIKNKINELFTDIVRGQSYHYLPGVKTFPPQRRVSDVLEERCQDIGNIFLRKELADMFIKELIRES